MDLCVWELCWLSNSHRNEIIWINETRRNVNKMGRFTFYLQWKSLLYKYRFKTNKNY